jgi:hypothetical protein
MQVVKQRMQTRQFPSAYQAVRAIAVKEGVAGLYAVCNFITVPWLHKLFF